MGKPTPTTPQSSPSHSTLHNFHVDVKMFGAMGDNSTDDSSAIQAALDAAATTGGTVYVPAGTYIIGTTLTIKDNVTLEGTGVGSTLKSKNSLNANLIQTSLTAANTFFVRIRQLRLDGNKANNTSGHLLYMFRAHTCVLELLHTQNGADRGIYLVGDGTGFALNNMIRNCRLEGPKNENVSIAGFAPNNMLSDCIIGGSDTRDVLDLQNDELLVRGCHIHSASQNGVYINGKNCLFECNIVESSGNHGIFADSNCIGGRIQGNVVFNNGITTSPRNGIDVKGTDNSVIGNRCFDRQGTMTQKYGILLEAASARNLVIGNVCRNSENVTAGILDSGTGNTLTSNGTA
jgi:hypothetical protein